ncbi:MAG: EMC3/TMCO1 family protein [Candidatus Pacearchaeota archaeon]
MINEIIIQHPKLSILVVSFLVTLFITIVTYYMTDRTRMKELKDKQKALREEVKKYRDNPQKMMELNKKMMEDMPEQLKHSFKPMIITMIPILIVFAWLRSTFALTSLAGSWLWWYILSSMVFSIFLRKIFGLQ